MSERTLKIESPHMRGGDVRGWQMTLNARLKRWGVTKNVLNLDSDYGVATRATTATVLYGLGIARSEMVHGVTPALRVKVRNPDTRSIEEKERAASRQAWRKELPSRFSDVHPPLAKVTQDSWGWHPGRHDGIDLICGENAMIFAMTAGEIVRVSASGWWGLGAPSDPKLRAKGDGIIILRCGTDEGPFKRGLHICYGHAEKAYVHEGQKVRAGQPLGHAGFAVAWHVHLMVNGNKPDSAGFVRGVGDRDPRPFYDYARKRG